MKVFLFIFSYLYIIQGVYALDHTHEKWNKILGSYVSMEKHSSTFNYKALKLETLSPYLNELSAVTKAQYDKFTGPQKLSFLINAYNAFTVMHILKNYPVESIRDIDKGFFGRAANNVWKKLKQNLLEQEMTLDHLEHQILRRDFNEPRIHFAINCASVGCPALLNEAFIPTKLESQLKRATSIFLLDRSRNYFDYKVKRIYVSKIFDWFRADFKKKYGSVKNFVLPFLLKDMDEFTEMRELKIKIRHTKYDWNLNETK